MLGSPLPESATRVPSGEIDSRQAEQLKDLVGQQLAAIAGLAERLLHQHLPRRSAAHVDERRLVGRDCRIVRIVLPASDLANDGLLFTSVNDPSDCVVHRATWHPLGRLEHRVGCIAFSERVSV